MSDDFDLTQNLRQEIRNLIQAKEAVDSLAGERKGLLDQSKAAKERILELMQRSSIDKANYEDWSVSVATSNRKECITTKNLQEILLRCLPDKDAAELNAKICDCLGTVSKPFIRLSKSSKTS